MTSIKPLEVLAEELNFPQLKIPVAALPVFSNIVGATVDIAAFPFEKSDGTIGQFAGVTGLDISTLPGYLAGADNYVSIDDTGLVVISNVSYVDSGAKVGVLSVDAGNVIVSSIEEDVFTVADNKGAASLAGTSLFSERKNVTAAITTTLGVEQRYEVKVSELPNNETFVDVNLLSGSSDYSYIDKKNSITYSGSFVYPGGLQSGTTTSYLMGGVFEDKYLYIQSTNSAGNKVLIQLDITTGSAVEVVNYTAIAGAGATNNLESMILFDVDTSKYYVGFTDSGASERWVQVYDTSWSTVGGKILTSGAGNGFDEWHTPLFVKNDIMWTRRTQRVGILRTSELFYDLSSGSPVRTYIDAGYSPLPLLISDPVEGFYYTYFNETGGVYTRRDSDMGTSGIEYVLTNTLFN